MAKISSLLAKLGLVYEQPDETAAVPAEAGPASAGGPEAGEAVRNLPEVALDTTAIGGAPQGDELDVDKVYASAGIKPPAHGFTVYRLMEMLEGEEFRGLDEGTRARVITGMLKRLPAGPVEVEEIVRDAAMRDRALDAFEAFMADRVAKREEEAGEHNRELQREIDELSRKNSGLIAANLAKVAEEKAGFERWRARKRVEEGRIFAAVAPFVEHNPITREGPPDTPPAPGRG